MFPPRRFVSATTTSFTADLLREKQSSQQAAEQHQLSTGRRIDVKKSAAPFLKVTSHTRLRAPLTVRTQQSRCKAVDLRHQAREDCPFQFLQAQVIFNLRGLERSICVDYLSHDNVYVLASKRSMGTTPSPRLRSVVGQAQTIACAAAIIRAAFAVIWIT